LFAETEDVFGRVHGVGLDTLRAPVRKGLREISDVEWQLSWDLIVRNAFLAVQIGASHMPRSGGGSIVRTSSVAGTGTTAARAVLAGAPLLGTRLEESPGVRA